MKVGLQVHERSGFLPKCWRFAKLLQHNVAFRHKSLKISSSSGTKTPCSQQLLSSQMPTGHGKSADLVEKRTTHWRFFACSQIYGG
jgi:hypothetical protein